jgi:hypothetical protein
MRALSAALATETMKTVAVPATWMRLTPEGNLLYK